MRNVYEHLISILSVSFSIQYIKLQHTLLSIFNYVHELIVVSTEM